jgi:hypothetical protein
MALDHEWVVRVDHYATGTNSTTVQRKLKWVRLLPLAPPFQSRTKQITRPVGWSAPDSDRHSESHWLAPALGNLLPAKHAEAPITAPAVVTVRAPTATVRLSRRLRLPRRVRVANDRRHFFEGRLRSTGLSPS